MEFDKEVIDTFEPNIVGADRFECGPHLPIARLSVLRRLTWTTQYSLTVVTVRHRDVSVRPTCLAMACARIGLLSRSGVSTCNITMVCPRIAR